MEASLFELGKGEAIALADFHVVADGGAMDGGSEGPDRPGTELCGEADAVTVTADLAAWLVEPCLDAPLPVLAEVVAGDLCRRESASPDTQVGRGSTHRCYGSYPFVVTRVEKDQRRVSGQH